MLLFYRYGFALVTGLLFGLGLAVAQMIDPAKVVNFLNVFFQWDPSLMLVMGGALAVTFVATPLVLKRDKPLVAERFSLPGKSKVDGKIIAGGVIFGVGWGLAGYCPGPLIVSLSFFNADILTVFAAYVVGTLVTKWLMARSA